MTQPRVNVAIAISAPILAAGIKACLIKIPDNNFNIIEISGFRQLIDICNSHEIRLVIVNPSFGGIFNPASFRSQVPDNIRIILVETGPGDEQSRLLFDQSVSIMDDVFTIASKIQKILDCDSPADKTKELLSLREKEIVALVVRGLTNKEIADKLFISVHTVITHRRNIARKLEIHSATGLTVYAIVNHLVDISDIRI